MTSQTRRTEKIAATSSVDLERDPRSIIGTREFDAPRALVLSAWTDVSFEEIVPQQRIVYRHGGGDDVEPVQFRQTMIFEDLGGRTRITWRGEFPSAAERDRVIKEYGADKGLAETLTRLRDYVAAMAQA
jgi:uncharacterized protein YndB with AHSA1/START domain